MPSKVKHDQPWFLVWRMLFDGFCHISPDIFEIWLMLEQFHISKMATGNWPYCTHQYSVTVMLYNNAVCKPPYTLNVQRNPIIVIHVRFSNTEIIQDCRHEYNGFNVALRRNQGHCVKFSTTAIIHPVDRHDPFKPRHTHVCNDRNPTSRQWMWTNDHSLY